MPRKSSRNKPHRPRELSWEPKRGCAIIRLRVPELDPGWRRSDREDPKDDYYREFVPLLIAVNPYQFYKEGREFIVKEFERLLNLVVNEHQRARAVEEYKEIMETRIRLKAVGKRASATEIAAEIMKELVREKAVEGERISEREIAALQDEKWNQIRRALTDINKSAKLSRAKLKSKRAARTIS